MAANSTDLRQHLLTRSDLAAMAVADDRVDAWLASGELALVDMVEEATGSTAVYAATTDSLRDQLQLLLEQNGRSGVMLAKDEVCAAMQQASEAELTPTAEDVIAEHSAEEQLDQAIDAITDVIDDLVESNSKFPADLKSEEAVALTDEVVVEDAVPAADAAPEPSAEPVREATVEDVGPAPEATTAASPKAVVRASERVDEATTREPAVAASAAPAPPPMPAQAQAPTPTPAPVVQPIVQIDLQPVVDALQQVHLAVLALGERPQPQFDPSPITAALDHGIRALQQDIANAADRTVLREGIENLREAITTSSQSVVEAVQDASSRATSAANAAAAHQVSSQPARGFDLAAAIATVAIATGWGIAIWTFAGDARLALGAVVCANLVGCCALMLRRR